MAESPVRITKAANLSIVAYPEDFVAPDLIVNDTRIPGVFVVDSPVYADNRGTFEEFLSHERLIQAGLPAFTVAQINVTTNTRGATRGIHSEGWQKWASPLLGNFDIVVLDMRPEEKTLGQFVLVHTVPGRAVYIPPGCGHGYQAQTEGGVYAFTASRAWTPQALQDFVNPFAQDLQIPWRTPLSEAVLLNRELLAPDFQEWLGRIATS
ncbi:MAG TPA: dTDP-4-dehydrorhamnose 3,5-epimerase family protein [Candidatus Limnocylindrales bacterium]|nr:dTDP-4-dehydrorhamnose 3,5-epimerase family protein [Candidatus Limnocylindrales bacterium]